MNEFLFPTYGEWHQEYRRWPLWEDYDPQRWDPSTIFTHVLPLMREPLSLPPQHDYYRPERAALVIGTLCEQPPAVRHGGLAFAAWMVRQNDTHLPTSLMGAEICQGMGRLGKEFNMNVETTGRITELLKENSDSPEFEPAAGEIVADWLQETKGETPLAAWLRNQASAEGESLGRAHHAD